MSQFTSGRATLTPESQARLDELVEYMTHKKTAHLEISGHTDNVGKRAIDEMLSQARSSW